MFYRHSFQFLIPCLVVLGIAHSSRADIVDFEFHSSSREYNAPGQSGEGDVYRFSNVGTVNGQSFDALVTLGSLGNGGYYTGSPKVYPYNDGDLNVTLSGTPENTPYGEFTMKLVNSGTNTAANPLDMQVSIYDLDSDGNDYYDFVSAKGFSSATVSPNTHLRTRNIFNGEGYTTWTAQNQYDNHGVNREDFSNQQDHTVTLNFSNTNELAFRFGIFGSQDDFIPNRLFLFDMNGTYAVPQEAPEPSSILLLAGTGGIGAFIARRRKGKQAIANTTA